MDELRGFRYRLREPPEGMKREDWYILSREDGGAPVFAACAAVAVSARLTAIRVNAGIAEYGPVQCITDPPYVFPGGEGQIVKPSEQGDPLRPDLAVGVRVRIRGGVREGVIRRYDREGSFITAGHLWAVQWDDGIRTEHNFSCDLTVLSTGAIATTFEGFCLLDWCSAPGPLTVDNKFCSLRCVDFDARRTALQKIKADTIERAFHSIEGRFVVPRAEEIYKEGADRLRAEFFALRWAP